DLVHRALVAMYGLHHPLEDGIEELTRLLGIAVREQFHRALQIREQDGDLLSLAFQGALRGEDLFGDMSRGVRLMADEAAPRLGAERDATGPAELLAWRDRGATARAGCLEADATLLAETRVRIVFSLASGTLHAWASTGGRRTV